MGGLVARPYLESDDFGLDLYKQDVNKIVELGTPNHGVNYFPPSIVNFSFAENEMLYYSSFLNTLNFNSLTAYQLIYNWCNWPLETPAPVLNQTVEYSTIAGSTTGNTEMLDSDPWILVGSVYLEGVPLYKFNGINHDNLPKDNEVANKTKSLLAQSS